RDDPGARGDRQHRHHLRPRAGAGTTDMTMRETIEPVNDPDFSAQARREGRAIAVKLVGNADLNVKAQLDRFISAVHEEGRRSSAEEVNVDLREMEFMNSSCLKTFVWWISSV